MKKREELFKKNHCTLIISKFTYRSITKYKQIPHSCCFYILKTIINKKRNAFY